MFLTAFLCGFIVRPHKIREGVRILESKGYEGDFTQETVLGTHGGDRTNEQVTTGNLKTGGNRSIYTEARLKRDRPDLLEKVHSGELSANRAAIEAGFRKSNTVYIKADPPGGGKLPPPVFTFR